MIKLNKQECPEILQQNKESWTQELLQAIKNEDKTTNLKNKYNHPEIKKILKEDCYEKCMYCESKVTHIDYGDIEHIKPKTKYPDLTFDWDNLGFACKKCNNNKHDHYDEQNPFVNPFQENPSEFFYSIGAIIRSKEGNTRAEITENTIKLNRPELIERRHEHLQQINLLIKIYNKTDKQEIKEEILEEIKKMCNPNKQYSMCSTAIFNKIT